MMALLARLARRRDGAAAMELALVMPVLFGLVMVALDFSGAWLIRLNLEQAAQRGIELAVARKGVATDYNYVLTEVTSAWGKPYTSASVDSWLECGGVRQSSTSANCNGAQIARYLSVQITAEYVPSFGWGGVIKGSTANGGFNVTGDATVRLQ